MKKITVIIGARPQFIKHAPLELVLNEEFQLNTVHTGQHYDDDMSSVFFDELGILKPTHMLNIGSHSHGKQTGRMMEGLEDILMKEKPSGVLVYGDTNSTLAGALVAQKLHIPVFHVEAGLRSGNKKMPEEVNRILTDNLSDLLFAPTEMAVKSLKSEGITEGVFLVGDVMYDLLKFALNRKIVFKKKNSLNYYYATVHRPYNTDDPIRLQQILDNLNKLKHKVYLAIHPRTLAKSQGYGMDLNKFSNISILPPQSYFENLNWLYNSKGLITDSGGMQKEAYWLKKKCITVRSETEWKETLLNNWNELVFENLSEIAEKICNVPGTHYPDVYGKGNTSYLIKNVISKSLN